MAQYSISVSEACDLVSRTFQALDIDLEGGFISGEAMTKLSLVLAAVIGSAPTAAAAERAIQEFNAQLPMHIDWVRRNDILRGEHVN